MERKKALDEAVTAFEEWQRDWTSALASTWFTDRHGSVGAVRELLNAIADLPDREGRWYRSRHHLWDRQTLLGDIEAIPTPGHTVGSACYFYRSPHGRTYLFTGDTTWPARGSWTSATFEDDSKQSSHRASLDLLATLESDVVLSAVAPGETFKEIAPAEWPAATEAAKARLG